MKVLFLQNVNRVANKGDIKDVNQGYATNFLLPNKLAKPVSDQQIIQIEKENINHQQMAKVGRDVLARTFQEMKGKEVILNEKANDVGHLFSKVHKKEIRDAIQSQLRINLDEKMIDMKEAIKSVGQFDIKIVDKDLSTTIKIIVESSS